MTANAVAPDATVLPAPATVLGAGLWTRLTCAGAACRYQSEHPGPPAEADLARLCPLCGGVFAAVTVYRLGATT